MTASPAKASESDHANRPTDTSTAENDATLSRLNRLIEDAKSLGCVEALKKHDHNISYLTDPRRSSYIDVADPKSSEDVLEIGSSMGQHTRLIGKRCRTLCAIEIVPLQAEFAKIWCKEDGLENVTLSSGGGSGTLPYEDDSFDLVICNYVLEWCAGRTDVPAHEFHTKFLADIFRVCRPGGRLFLSTKNRFSFRYLLGSEDEHLGIRFGSSLPRRIQSLARRRADLGHPTGHLHSWRALESILASVGFGPCERILAFPDARYPDYVGPINDVSQQELRRQTKTPLGRKNKMSLRLPTRLFQSTTNSLVFVAHKA